jgi:high affinity Mn2+ porin
MRGTQLLGACAVLAAFTCNQAAAAELPFTMPFEASSTPSPLGWTGFYFGGHFGYATGKALWLTTEPGGSFAEFAGSVDLFKPYDLFKGTGSYFQGLQAGYNHSLRSRVVLGVEADISAPNMIAGSKTFWSPSFGPADFGEQVLLSGTVRGRIGYAFDHWLGYGTAGFAWSYDRLTRTQNSGTPTGGDANGDSTESALLWRLGWGAGAGIELPLSPNWTARVEYLITGFGHSTVTFPAAEQRFDSNLYIHSVRLGMNYQLGDDLAKTDVFTKGPSALELARFSFHGQTTFTAQYAFPFRSPYRGQNSLDPNSGRETWDTTFYVGARLWEGAELWINPEIDQGFGLSGTFGVAGFPSAEAYKVGASYPYARVPRAFIRQTIDLGGETQKVDSGINQFSGSQSANRVVIAAGKLATVDIFDTNKYAHDPRTDFLNWTLADTATFDYAADAWAFTYGTAVEWYQGQWTLRAGIFDLPIVPNSTDLDPTFKQFQMIGEIEHRHELWGQPGKFAVTGFLGRSRLGRFEDAILLAQASGTLPDLAAVRRYTGKTGISANMEQQITRDDAIFARAGFNSKELETNAFTDADRTAAAGISLSGRLWYRPDDVFGFGGILNHISSAHRAYLDAGGLTAILGDGKLPNPGPEEIIEAYYSLPVFSWRLTLDYQFINNPAYNSDRGPVSVVATRLHTQF